MKVYELMKELESKPAGAEVTVVCDVTKEELEELLVDPVKEFELDMGACDYVASSGLRAILWAQKKMNGLGGSMVVKNVIGDVMEVFEMTGFADILTFA